jgi:hypothetical protein
MAGRSACCLCTPEGIAWAPSPVLLGCDLHRECAVVRMQGACCAVPSRASRLALHAQIGQGTRRQAAYPALMQGSVTPAIARRVFFHVGVLLHVGILLQGDFTMVSAQALSARRSRKSRRAPRGGSSPLPLPAHAPSRHGTAADLAHYLSSNYRIAPLTPRAAASNHTQIDRFRCAPAHRAPLRHRTSPHRRTSPQLARHESAALARHPN